MLFNSLHFASFFVVVTALYFLASSRLRVYWLLAASCYFYMAFIPIYILVLFTTIIADYFLGIAISNSQKHKRHLLFISIVANVGFLAIFKYYNFFSQNVSYVANALGRTNSLFPLWEIALPIGLSFHTFQAMSYTIEVYRGKVPPERNFATYALYVMFYPQLVAGPIERPQNILHQLHLQHDFEPTRIVRGLRLILWGLFKKVVIADRVAIIVDHVYDQPQNFTGSPLIIATVLFAIQIYCDFSGYCDIAIGCAEVMGIRLMENFRRPYFSASISEFWRRWHISLSTWFRDYVYIPLGGGRGTLFTNYRNLLIVFLVSGLWHGANWTFIAWGALNGLLLIAEARANLIRIRLRGFGQSMIGPTFAHIGEVLFTFSLICVTWVFFRAKSIPDALFILQNWYHSPLTTLYPAWASGLGAEQFDWLIAILAIGVLVAVEVAEETHKLPFSDLIARQPTVLRWLTYYGLCMAIICLGVMGTTRQFIYFQF